MNTIKHILLQLAVLLAFFFIGAVTLSRCAYAGSDSSYHCPGFEPYPPVGCKGPPRCMCDSEGNCGWVFDCGN